MKSKKPLNDLNYYLKFSMVDRIITILVVYGIFKLGEFVYNLLF